MNKIRNRRNYKQYRDTNILREYCEQLYADKLDSLEQVDNVLWHTNYKD